MVPKKRVILTVAILVSLLITTYVLTIAQSTITSVEPVPPLDAPPNKHIVYFVTEDTGQVADLVAPQKLEASLGSQTAQSWGEVVNKNTERPIDALIIHNSKLGEVDRNWVSEAYRRGVVIAGINLSGQQIADLVGNPCIARDSFAADTSSPMFVMVSSSVSGENPEDIGKVVSTITQSCGEATAEGVVGQVSVVQSRATDLLDTENGYNIFTRQLALYLEN